MKNFNHKVRAVDIEWSLITGEPVSSICGDRFRVRRQGANATPGNDVESRVLPMCPLCEAVVRFRRESKRKPEDVSA